MLQVTRFTWCQNVALKPAKLDPSAILSSTKQKPWCRAFLKTEILNLAQNAR